MLKLYTKFVANINIGNKNEKIAAKPAQHISISFIVLGDNLPVTFSSKLIIIAVRIAKDYEIARKAGLP